VARLRQRRSLEITYRGRPIRCAPGDSVAAALLDAGEHSFRATRFGDRRGVFCGMGVCHECVVTIDGVPGHRACVTTIRDGMSVEPGEPAPSLVSAAPLRLCEQELSPSVLVIGGGPAGLAAAAAAAEAGADVVLVDERPKLGGQYFKQPTEGLEPDTLDRQYRQGRALIERSRRAGATILLATQVWAAFGRNRIYAISPTVAYTLRPKRLVLATGAYERGVPMPGWTLPGYMTSGAAQTLLRSYGVAPGRRVLVSGNGPLNVQVAAEIVRAGANVVAIAELARLTSPRHTLDLARMVAAAPGLVATGIGHMRTLVGAQVPLLYGSAVVRVAGAERVEQATVMRIDGAGLPIEGTERTFEVDAVCAGFGFLPSNEIARALGCRHTFDAECGQLVAEVGPTGRSSVDDVWIVGDGGGVAGARVAQALGFLGGLEAAGVRAPAPLAREAAGMRRKRRRAERFQRALSGLYAAPRLLDQLAEATTLVCRCENVPLRAVEDAYASGIRESGAVKRVSRAGMGGCQGRYCGAFLSELGARRRGGPPDEFSGFAPALPFKPVPISSITRCFTPAHSTNHPSEFDPAEA
jgi:NADPH-dependent 2,4-dienoyl-CoA reductase/sulfur reductase-like enzyme